MKELLLALPAGRRTQCGRWGLVPAHMAYRVGPGPRLMAASLPAGLRGGYMLLDCQGFDGTGDPLPCARQILTECRRRDYRGIVCDFEGVPSGCLPRLVELLDRNCPPRGWTLYVPESCASFVKAARILVSSAMAGGILERRLRAAAERYGHERTALAVEWVREDFPLPASGRGTPVSREKLEEQIVRLEPAVFFDRGLCAHYYTYMDRDKAHFVLFDSPRSVREKLAAAERAGLCAALLPGPELESCLGEIFEPGQGDFLRCGD